LPAFIAGDPLRAIAAVSVVGYHAALTAMVSVGSINFTPAGFTGPYGQPGRLLFGLEHGLYLFFVLSGYLIARPFVQSFIAGQPPPPTWSYLRNRALRIIPLFWFVTTLVVIRYGSEGASGLDVVGVYLFGQNYTHEPAWVNGVLAPAWTLNVELLFYLLVPLVTVALSRIERGRLDPRGRLRLVLGLAAVVFLASLALRQALPTTLNAQRQILPTLFAFMPGVALAAIEPSATAAVRRGATAWLRDWWLIAVGLALLAAELWLPLDLEGPRGLLIAAGAGALVAAPLLRQWRGRSIWGWLDNRVLHWVGVRSYSLYLLHVPLMAELVELDLMRGNVHVRFLEMYALGLAVALPAAALTFRFVELPFLRRRRRAPTTPDEPRPELPTGPEAAAAAPARADAG
jgi:peptidoglycan/LPS O-acetylase OafA/YrhL